MYKEKTKKQLASYKVKQLGVLKDGIWKTNKKPYPHILPTEQKELNLLEPYRADLLSYIAQQKIQLHRDFHHLNSSQAVCLNFFYPLLKENLLPLLLNILKNKEETVEICEFEKVISRSEGTNFDFYIRLKSGKQIFFEIKYTESGFKKEQPSEAYQAKHEVVYKERLVGKLRPGINEYETLMKNYQLLRNISYVDASDQNLLVIICPEGNIKLRQEYETLVDNLIAPALHKNIRFLTWETIWTELMDLLLASPAVPERLRNQYKLFGEKYLADEKNDLYEKK
ncbi:PGN_0703 family putative restriction endonuclease [Planococcus sp. CAU13]|uniref:PGN_0703 family putative restriction endonuclease n=1 Tax=Planococcus sp. CAU13 TaxID=1541197 RepID=UPI00052FF77B|nr:hypothetical protein [Planococcus sp. CAU13]